MASVSAVPCAGGCWVLVARLSSRLAISLLTALSSLADLCLPAACSEAAESRTSGMATLALVSSIDIAQAHPDLELLCK